MAIGHYHQFPRPTTTNHCIVVCKAIGSEDSTNSNGVVTLDVSNTIVTKIYVVIRAIGRLQSVPELTSYPTHCPYKSTIGYVGSRQVVDFLTLCLIEQPTPD